MRYTYDYRDRTFYERVWDILVEHAGASREGYQKTTFVDAFCQREYKASEFRFCGTLGFGGKFWRNCGMFYVNCYMEDENPKRRNTKDKVNALIEALVKELNPYPYGPPAV